MSRAKTSYSTTIFSQVLLNNHNHNDNENNVNDIIGIKSKNRSIFEHNSGKPVEKPGEKSVESAVESFYKDRAAKVEQIAQDLCNRLDNPGAYKWYMKLAWNLPPNILYRNLEQAQGGHCPKALFTWLCQRSMRIRQK